MGNKDFDQGAAYATGLAGYSDNDYFELKRDSSLL